MKNAVIDRISDYLGDAVQDYSIYDYNDCYYVYPNGFYEAVLSEPLYYSILIVSHDGTVVKDRWGIFGSAN